MSYPQAIILLWSWNLLWTGTLFNVLQLFACTWSNSDFWAANILMTLFRPMEPSGCFNFLKIVKIAENDWKHDWSLLLSQNVWKRFDDITQNV